jgi:hypothetical protein
MKKFLLLVVLFISCKKDSVVKEKTTAIKVSDSITGTPVAGADLYMWSCGGFGCSFGTTTVFSGKTDNSGIVNVPSSAYNDVTIQLNVGKSDYLPFEVQRSTNLLLRPKGWLRLRIVKTANYPAGSRIFITNEFNPRDLLVNAAADSIVVMTGGGGVLNHLLWSVIDGQGQKLGAGNGTVQLPRLDTTNVTLNY